MLSLACIHPSAQPSPVYLCPTPPPQSASGGDIRLILGQLQMIRLRAKSLTYDQARGLDANH